MRLFFSFSFYLYHEPARRVRIIINVAPMYLSHNNMHSMPRTRVRFNATRTLSQLPFLQPPPPPPPLSLSKPNKVTDIAIFSLIQPVPLLPRRATSCPLKNASCLLRWDFLNDLLRFRHLIHVTPTASTFSE